MPAIMGSSRLEKLEEIKHIIKALLIVDIKKDVTPHDLNQEFCSMEGHNIPYKDYNFTCLVDFLRSLDDICYLQYNKKDQLCVHHISSDKTKHISDLILRTKEKDSKKSNKKSKTKINENTVSPTRLFYIFNKLARESSHNNGIIKVLKQKVLSALYEVDQVRFFYGMVNLEMQLNHYNHILKYDDHYIIFKEKNIPLFKNISDMIGKSTINNLKKLLEKHSDGIICSDLPTLYCREYKVDLEYSQLGFNDVVEFVIALNDIMKLVFCPDTKKQLIIGAKKSVKDFLNSSKNCRRINSSIEKSIDFIMDPVPKVASPNVTKTLIPNNVASCDNVIEQISITSLNNNDEILVIDVFSPSFFWITPLRNKGETDVFVKNMDEFYKLNAEKYKIPTILIQVGLQVACTYGDVWYRGVIKKIEHNTIIVLLYDYGSLNKCKAKDLYFLDNKFTLYPAQAIPCSLYNVQPLNKKWSRESCKAFSDKVLNKRCKIYIQNIIKELDFMIINLELQNKFNLDVSKWMIEEGLAAEGQFYSEKQYNTLKHYKRCMKNPTEVQKEYFHFEKKLSKKITETSHEAKKPNYVSKAKKLEILKKYRERLSSTSQESAISSSSAEVVESNKVVEKTKIKVQKTSNDDSIKILEDTSESTLSEFSNSESSSESSNYKMTEHESSYTKLDSNLSPIFLSDNSTTLDSDDTEYFSVTNTSSKALSNSCNKTILQFTESNKSSTGNSFYKNAKESRNVVNEVEYALKELRFLLKK